MKKVRGLGVLAVVVFAFGISAVLNGGFVARFLTVEAKNKDQQPQLASEQLLVKLKSDSPVDKEKVKKVVSKHVRVKNVKNTFTNVNLQNTKNTFSVEIDESEDVLGAVTVLRNDPEIEFVQLNYAYTPDLVPNDTLFASQYAHTKTQAPLAWDLTTGAPSVTIAPIGTGVQWDHTDLAANIWSNTDEIASNSIDDDNNGYIDDVRGWNFELNSNNPAGVDSHETSVAGVVAASTNNATGVAGVCWQCTIMPLRVSYTTANVAEAIYYAVDNGAKIINMSFGSYDMNKYGPDTLVEQAVNYAITNNVLVVATAGNDSTNVKRFPGALENVIGVASTDSGDNRSGFSNWGEWVDVAAPGTGIYSTTLNNGYASVNGTSFSAPYVAGVAGLLFSRFPTLAVGDAKNILEYTVDKINTDRPIGSGRISVQKAIVSDVLSGPFSIIKKPWNNFALPLVGQQEIWGTAIGDSYVLEYQPEGGAVWTEIGSGSQVINGVLGNLDVTNLPSQLYTLRLTTLKGAITDMHSVSVSLERSYQAGFPLALGGNALLSPVTTFDFDGNGTLEMVLGSNSGKVFVVDINGSIVAGWPKTAIQPYVYGAPAVGDIDGDGQPEIVVSSYGGGTVGGGVSAWHKDGSIVSGWPKATGQIRGSVMLANLDADSALEVVVASAGVNGASSTVHAWKGNGNIMLGWPYLFPESNLQTSPAFGDVTGDGLGEVVATSGGYTAVINNSGNQLALWTRGFSLSSPVLFNFDGDNKLEIGAQENMQFNIRDGNGSIKLSKALDATAGYAQSAVGNIDNDFSLPEVVLGDANPPYSLYTYNLNGNARAGWPISLSSPIKNPTIGDIDGDSVADILVAAESGRIYAYDNQGLLLPGFPKGTGSAIYTAVSITDLDGDGDVELIVGAEDGNLYVWDLLTSYNTSAQPWPSARQNPQNTGSLIVELLLDQTPPTVSITAPTSGAVLTGTVAISATASDAVGIAKVDFYRDNDVLVGTDVTAPYTANLNTAVLTVGAHTLYAIAVDTSNNPTTSTPVNVTVSDQQAPVTNITSPLNNSLVNRNSNVTIQATATDNVGISKVEFYVGTVLKCIDIVAPYSCIWAVPASRKIQYQLQTKAYDAANNFVFSPLVTVTSK